MALGFSVVEELCKLFIDAIMPSLAAFQATAISVSSAPTCIIDLTSNPGFHSSASDILLFGSHL